MFFEHQKNAHSNAKVNSYIDGTNLLVPGFIGDQYLILFSFLGIAYQLSIFPGIAITKVERLLQIHFLIWYILVAAAAALFGDGSKEQVVHLSFHVQYSFDTTRQGYRARIPSIRYILTGTMRTVSRNLTNASQ